MRKKPNKRATIPRRPFAMPTVNLFMNRVAPEQTVYGCPAKTTLAIKKTKMPAMKTKPNLNATIPIILVPVSCHVATIVRVNPRLKVRTVRVRLNNPDGVVPWVILTPIPLTVSTPICTMVVNSYGKCSCGVCLDGGTKTFAIVLWCVLGVRVLCCNVSLLIDRVVRFFFF